MTWPEAFNHAGPWMAFWLALGISYWGHNRSCDCCDCCCCEGDDDE